MLGKGKYDDLCTELRKKAGPNASVMTIVIDGKDGDGFSCQMTYQALKRAVSALRSAADQMEQDLAKLGASN